MYKNNTTITSDESKNIAEVDMMTSNSIIMNELSDGLYTINGVSFLLSPHSSNTYNGSSDYYSASFSEISFNGINTEYNEYNILRKPIINIKMNNNNYLLFSYEWENDNIFTVMYQLKNGKIVCMWETYGYLDNYYDNKISIRAEIYSYGLLDIDVFDIVSEFELNGDMIEQIGDYTINKIGDFEVGKSLPVYLYDEKNNKYNYEELLVGEKIRFTHTDFNSRLWFTMKNGMIDGYLNIDLNDSFNHEVLLSIYINGTPLSSYSQNYIDLIDKERTREKEEDYQNINNIYNYVTATEPEIQKKQMEAYIEALKKYYK